MIDFDRNRAKQMDKEDPLKDFRQRFVFRDPGMIYLDGNSLGMLPTKATAHLQGVIEQEWGARLIRSWNEGWYERSSNLAARIARLIGARHDEVILGDSTSVNLYKLAWAALKYQQGRKGVVSDSLNFPSDIYVLQGLVEAFGNQHELRLANSHDGMGVSMEALEKNLGNDTALLSLSHVLFKSAFMYDMKAVTALAHQKGALVLWDLSHATGAVPVDLNDCNVDLAIGCTYKYLNGGPGSPAFLYVRKDLQEKLQSPIQGWFGQNHPFDFQLKYEPAHGIERFLAGTPPLLSLSALEPALEILLEAGMDRVREKSIALTGYLIQLFHHFLKPLGYVLGTPENDNERGSHVALRHPEAYRICKALLDADTCGKVVIPDFREPDNIRLGITPLYTSWEDVFEACRQLRLIADQQLYERFDNHREKVT